MKVAGLLTEKAASEKLVTELRAEIAQLKESWAKTAAELKASQELLAEREEKWKMEAARMRSGASSDLFMSQTARFSSLVLLFLADTWLIKGSNGGRI